MTVMEFKTLHLIMHECGFFALDGRLIKKEDPEADDITVTLEMVLAFATGSDHEPPPLLGLRMCHKYNLRQEKIDSSLVQAPVCSFFDSSHYVR